MFVWVFVFSMSTIQVQIEESWNEALRHVFLKPYFPRIVDTLKGLKDEKRVIYPPGRLIFNAFDKTPFDKVKVVIIGQDPYHGQGQAMGLCFSVAKGIRIPPSLINIFKELNRDLGNPIPKHGDLTTWAERGVFLLNASLTVEAGRPASHAKIGWQEFTDDVIQLLAQKRENLVFMLWGNFAKKKKVLIDQTRHFILESVHPSPLAGNRFIGNGHFSKANELLLKIGSSPIDWRIEDQ